MSRTRRSLRFLGVGDARLVEEEYRDPLPEEAVIAPLAVGVCGTDVHLMAGHFPAEPGIVLGHEICGRVLEPDAASADEPSALRQGDLVTVEPHRYCTRCSYCRAGDEHLCDSKRGYGVRLDGGLSTRMLVPGRILYRLPSDTPPWLGALTEPVACCVHGMDQLGARSGESVLINGCGPAGAILVSLARLAGLAPIVVAEPSAERRTVALAMGADLALSPDDLDQLEDPSGPVGGEGFAHLVDAVGSAAVLERAISLARRGARLLVFGVGRADDTFPLSPRMIYDKELTIVGSSINPYTHQRAVALLDRLRLQHLGPTLLGLDQWSVALEQQAAGAGKVFITPN
ncbi:MAG: alcohol dehydrogenase catalytic domain-containing protein [Propionibacteriaceae bacterium]